METRMNKDLLPLFTGPKAQLYSYAEIKEYGDKYYNDDPKYIWDNYRTDIFAAQVLLWHLGRSYIHMSRRPILTNPYPLSDYLKELLRNIDIDLYVFQQ